jgi:hypothetical protein
VTEQAAPAHRSGVVLRRPSNELSAADALQTLGRERGDSRLVRNHPGTNCFPRCSNGSIFVDAIEATIELCLLFTRKNEVLRLQTSPKIIDQFQLLVRGKSSKVDRRLGDTAILAHELGLARRSQTRLLAGQDLQAAVPHASGRGVPMWKRHGQP